MLAKIIEVTSKVLSNCDTAISDKIYQKNISRFAFFFFFFAAITTKVLLLTEKLFSRLSLYLFLRFFKIFSNAVILNSFRNSQENSNKKFFVVGIKYCFLIIEPIEYQSMCMSITILETAVKSNVHLVFHCCVPWIGKKLSF